MEVKRNTCFIAAIMFVVLILTSSSAFASERRFYVTEKGAGNNSGSSWSNALSGSVLASRLGGAQSGDIFCVAKGTYKPGASNSDSFILKNGVKLYGGFSGDESIDEGALAAVLSGRNLKTCETVLSGNIGSKASSKTVVKTDRICDSSSLIDGFTISGGRNEGGWSVDGGGMRIEGSPTVKNCVIMDNKAEGKGGGIYVNSSSGAPVIESCSFKSNIANNGGGLCVSDGEEVKILNCTFDSNSAKKDGFNTGGCGGGIYAGKKVTVVNCTFYGNGSDGGGNGLYNSANGSSVMSSTFYRNAGNTKSELYSFKSIAVTNSIFWSPEVSTDTMVEGKGDKTVTYCVVKGGYEGEGNKSGDPKLAETLADNDGRTQTLAITAPDSSAINNGTTVGAPEMDQRGKSRESSPDIGAYEYISVSEGDPNEPAMPDDPLPEANKKSSGCNAGGSAGFWSIFAVLALPILGAGITGRNKQGNEKF